MRDRDFIQLQSQYLAFLEDDLLPTIDSAFQTDVTDRALVGYSSGGEFVGYTLINQPELFNRLVAIDSGAAALLPIILEDNDDFRSSVSTHPVKLFISSTGTNDMSVGLQQREYEGLDAVGYPLGDVTHVAALHLSLAAGIMAIYAE